MSKRITLTTEEIEHIIKGLISLQNQTDLDYEVINTGKRVYGKIIDKLNAPTHPKQGGV